MRRTSQVCTGGHINPAAHSAVSAVPDNALQTTLTHKEIFYVSTRIVGMVSDYSS
jgi:hypothetical protein